MEFVRGDATDPCRRPAIIVHVCNDVGAWGAGFVLAVSRRWPEPERRYREWFRGQQSQLFKLGAVQFVAVEPDVTVANLVGQHGLRRRVGERPVRPDAIEKGLRTVCDRALATGASVHMPRIGCGLAGGSWSKIGPIVERTLCERQVPVWVYDP